MRRSAVYLLLFMSVSVALFSTTADSSLHAYPEFVFGFDDGDIVMEDDVDVEWEFFDDGVDDRSVEQIFDFDIYAYTRDNMTLEKVYSMGRTQPFGAYFEDLNTSFVFEIREFVVNQTSSDDYQVLGLKFVLHGVFFGEGEYIVGHLKLVWGGSVEGISRFLLELPRWSYILIGVVGVFGTVYGFYWFSSCKNPDNGLSQRCLKKQSPNKNQNKYKGRST